MTTALLVAGAVCFVLLMLFVAWLMNLEQRVQRLEAPRAPIEVGERPEQSFIPGARRRSSGAE